MQRLLEASPFIMVGLVIIGAFVMLFMFANDTIKYNSQMSSESTAKIGDLYKAFYDRNQYCSVMIAKYGTQAEQAKYNSLPMPDLNNTGG